MRSSHSIGALQSSLYIEGGPLQLRSFDAKAAVSHHSQHLIDGSGWL